MLKDEMRGRLKTAMKAGDTVEKEILRVALGEVQTEEARAGKDLDDAAVEKILRKLMKSNRETLDVTQDAAAKATLAQENAVIESLLPKTLGEEEIIAALADTRDAIAAAGNDGQATGIAMKALKSKALAVDGRTVSAAVRKIRSTSE
ncbi:MAG TPA: GatB/YqeY domain-containing protein [Polyangiaceae bacterium]|nr:GatB/YqeY domain-containing protein [Polyangiaceae bacterium]